MPKARDISYLPEAEQRRILDRRKYNAEATRRHYDKHRSTENPKKIYADLSQFTELEKKERVRLQTMESKKRSREDPARWLEIKQQTMRWRRSNPDSVKASRKRDTQINADTRAASSKIYREQPDVKTRRNERIRQRRRDDPVFRIARVLRSRLWAALNGELKAETTLTLVGCSLDSLIEHLESLFVEGMTWQNTGEWHVDHITPVASFDLSDPEEQRRCFHWTNLQPLWGEDNLKKGWKP
jgi:hypothetical protein